MGCLLSIFVLKIETLAPQMPMEARQAVSGPGSLSGAVQFGRYRIKWLLNGPVAGLPYAIPLRDIWGAWSRMRSRSTHAPIVVRFGSVAIHWQPR
jgi:hypothetical protein